MSPEEKQKWLERVEVANEHLTEFIDDNNPAHLAFAIGNIAEILPEIIQELSETKATADTNSATLGRML